MSEPRDDTTPYVRPAILRLDFEMDLPVSLASHCKTTSTTASGSSPCHATGAAGRPCTSVGS